MLSVIILTKNEEKMIGVCLESVRFADEIVIADNGSTDGTLDAINRIKNQSFDKLRTMESRINVIKYENQDFAELRNKAMEEAKGDWVLYVDADERVLESLKEEILKSLDFARDRQVQDDDGFSAFAIPRKNIIFGKEVNYGPYKKDWVIRLFRKKDFEKWSGKVHETPHFKGKLGYTKNSFLHLTHRGVDQMVLKSLEWSKIDAKLRLDSKHPKMSGWRFLRILITELWNQGIIRKGFFNGTVGIMDSLLQVFSLFITYVRLWELQQEKTLDQVYDEIDKELIENNFK